ncbi:MAG: hypothetical protein Q6366_001935 [Candidatus Freyarchaeota archaeon]
MPVGNERIVRALADAYRNEPLISPPVLKLFLEHANKYAREKFQLERNCDTIDELEAALIGLVGKHPSQDALVYGALKGESLLTGATGVISKRIGKEATKSLVTNLGLTEHLKGAKNLYDFLQKYKALLVAIGFVKDQDIKLTDLGNEEVEVSLSGDCSYLNVCIDVNKEGIYNVLGQVPCPRLIAFAGVAELILKRGFDVKILKYDPPNCKAKFFEI